MPSRLGILAIVLFWLVSTSWLIVREVAPLFRTGEPPAFFTDVTAEVGGTTINWNILHRGKPVGTGISTVRRWPDQTFRLVSDLTFQSFPFLKTWEIKKINSQIRVDRKGNLKELATLVKADTPYG